MSIAAGAWAKRPLLDLALIGVAACGGLALEKAPKTRGRSTLAMLMTLQFLKNAMAEVHALWHGTQTTWLPEIVSHGLGGFNPHQALGTQTVLREMVDSLEAHGVDIPDQAPKGPHGMRLAAETVPPFVYRGRTLNFAYGDTYVSLQEQVAAMYATLFAGELFNYTSQAALLLDANGLGRFVPAWRGWRLLSRASIPVLIRMPRLGPNRLRTETGAKLTPTQRRIVSGHEPSGFAPATDLTFRLIGSIPYENLSVSLLDQNRAAVPACARCVIAANPGAFPALPAEDVPFEPSGKPPTVRVPVEAQPGCSSPVHG